MGKFTDAGHLLRIYRGMVARCYSPKSQSYRYYGGRGISICQEWRDSPARFIAWAISHGYDPTLEIDRRDNDGNYCPENCRWVTRIVNQKNKRPSNAKASRFRGVWMQYTRGKQVGWRAGIRVDGKLVGLGSYRTQEDAARAYDRAARKQYGSEAVLNFPAEQVACL